MPHADPALVAWLDAVQTAPQPMAEILESHPDMTAGDSYRLQLAVMAARVARGDRIVGYKAALTSKAMQEETGIPEPMLGTLLASRVFAEEQPVSMAAAGLMRCSLEPEICVLLKDRLAGPGLSALDILPAIAGYLPALEIGDYRLSEGVGSLQSAVCCNTFNGGIVVGTRLTAPTGIDLRLEGMSMRLNDAPAGSGTGVEVLGDPLNSVAFMANKLAEFGGALEPGMLLMTGSITGSIPLGPGDRVDVEFTRLGSVSLRFTD